MADISSGESDDEEYVPEGIIWTKQLSVLINVASVFCLGYISREVCIGASTLTHFK